MLFFATLYIKRQLAKLDKTAHYSWIRWAETEKKKCDVQNLQIISVKVAMYKILVINDHQATIIIGNNLFEVSLSGFVDDRQNFISKKGIRVLNMTLHIELDEKTSYKVWTGWKFLVPKKTLTGAISSPAWGGIGYPSFPNFTPVCWGLFLESCKIFLDPKSRLSNCNPLNLKSWPLNVFFM